ncbi:hypothetical protein A2V49_01500 [candidate division WWE3 bacterium RBG_19FT_COMBO_34_6]|uniref:N-acetylmuramoyl-L-alanine amidase domain-containing protein n=1 Tax=candidate division WWE3 bacterium RBG_19FT_COMBO_34_6 TaxID=1802612 RepID=A0A1F4UJY8_UNCKA|nr:MAG: hypothetical protein A2V49_01500 [candidate division WWE3 bacterium RBG_19FT_COMBO_34_6]
MTGKIRPKLLLVTIIFLFIISGLFWLDRSLARQAYESSNTPTPVPGRTYIYFGDYYKELPRSAYVSRIIVPDTIVIHTDDQSGNIPERWNTLTTWYGLEGREGGGRSVHFGVSLDGVAQYLPMFTNAVIQCRGVGLYTDRHSIQIEMGGRTYDYLITGKASPEMEKSIRTTTGFTVKLTASLMEYYKISLENVVGHYKVGLGKSDPGQLYFEQYFLPELEKEIEKRNLNKMELSLGD